MRMNTTYLLGIAAVTLPLLSTAASAAYTTNSSQSTQIAQAQTSCPPGTYWENGGYVADGKWRDGHCANDNGRQ
jgi:hypothetical protein